MGLLKKFRKFVGGNRYLVLHSPDARTAFTKKYERPLIIPHPEKG